MATEKGKTIGTKTVGEMKEPQNAAEIIAALKKVPLYFDEFKSHSGTKGKCDGVFTAPLKNSKDEEELAKLADSYTEEIHALHRKYYDVIAKTFTQEAIVDMWKKLPKYIKDMALERPMMSNMKKFEDLSKFDQDVERDKFLIRMRAEHEKEREANERMKRDNLDGPELISSSGSPIKWSVVENDPPALSERFPIIDPRITSLEGHVERTTFDPSVDYWVTRNPDLQKDEAVGEFTSFGELYKTCRVTNRTHQTDKPDK